VTIVVDDAGSGDLLFGVVIGLYHTDKNQFVYGVVDVKYFQAPRFRRREYLKQTSKLVQRLLEKFNLKDDEEVKICQGAIFDQAVKDLKKQLGDTRVQKIKVTGVPQYFTELAYLDEIRNLGYEPLPEREEKRAKSFFHMMRWLKANPDMLKHAKTGWPRLSKYRLFRSQSR
jgi:hypothetical protein